MQQAISQQFLSDIEELMIRNLADLKNNKDCEVKDIKEILLLFAKLLETQQLSKELLSGQEIDRNNNDEINPEDKEIILRYLLQEKSG